MSGNNQKFEAEIAAGDTPENEENETPGEADLMAEENPAGDNEDDDAGTGEEDFLQELETARQKAAENLELAQRTQAEMENLRKRTIRDIENAHKYALERFVSELLPVIDSLELGIQAADSVADTDSLKEGMHLTLKKFTDTLEKFGVVTIEPQGQKFNPDMHDAVSMAETDEYDSGIVMAVLQKGYELNGRLVRPAMVVVAK